VTDIRGFDPGMIGTLRRSAAYDIAARLPLLAWAIGFAVIAAFRLLRYLQQVDPMLSDLVFAISVAMQFAVIAFFITLAGTVLTRARPAGRARGFEPRLSAVIGTFLVPVVVLFPRRDLSLAASLMSTVLLLVGNVLAVYCLAHLGRSFSIMPEARGLVTSGLYRHIRHPLYLAEMIAAAGTVLQYLSPWTGLIFAVQIAFQLRRMHNEEQVLTAKFPAYHIYMAKTARLLPRIY
jgi:protein-S-isoprenylcysteine O-methyltransferase Ste14